MNSVLTERQLRRNKSAQVGLGSRYISLNFAKITINGPQRLAAPQNAILD